MTVILKPAQCLFCARRAFPPPGVEGNPARQTCTAFPGGIPDPIWHNQVDHRKPYSGDHGQQFEAIAGMAFPDWVPVKEAMSATKTPAAVDPPAPAPDPVVSDPVEPDPVQTPVAGQCVVNDGTGHTGRAVNGLVCSRHANRYHADGTPR